MIIAFIECWARVFTTKKKKIATYLQNIPDVDKTPFDNLLVEYLDRTLKTNLQSIGITKLEIHVDWLEHAKCIGVQGKYQAYFMDLQIYPDKFTVAFDLVEADDDEEHPFRSKEQMYDVLAKAVNNLK